MSYTPGFAPDAQSQWQALEPRFQEIVLDKLDELALSPPATSEQIVDAAIEEGALHHYIFLHALIDHQSKTVIAVGVGHHARGEPQP